MNPQSSQANVIPLQANKLSDSLNNEAVMKESLARLPSPVQRIREIAQSHLKGSIQNLFDHVDDSLFELADRALSNLEQNVFFESMREIRIHRRRMEKSFLHHIDQHFAGLLSENEVDLPQTSEFEEGDVDDLSLVSKDELEELVATDSLVSKAWAQNKSALRVLAARMNTLVSVGISKNNYPLTPRALADSFVAASTMVNVDIKAKLVLFKLFERYVMNELASVLSKVNHSLTEQGVPIPKTSLRRSNLAHNPAPTNKRSATTVNTQIASEGASAPGPEATGLYATLKSLLETQPQNSQASFSEATYAPAPDSYSVTEVSYALLNALSQLQQQQVQQVPVANTLQVDQPQLLSSGNIQSAIQSATGEQLVDAHSQDVIKLVDMLFSFILEDRNLPDPVKLLLARLQIPFIKVALADDEFFKKDGHPARRLLNEMAMASIGWTGDTENSKRDTLLHKIESTVAKILEEFDSNFEIFTLLLTDFIAFMEKERRRVMLFEKRAIDAEDGKAKSELGRQKVDAQLNGLVEGKTLPDAFTGFIQGPWSNILFLIYMRQGAESQQWANALKIAKELVWSALPIKNDAHKDKLTVLAPRLQSAIKKGLENISFSPSKQSKFFEKFNAHYSVLFDNYSKPSALTPPVEEVPAERSVTKNTTDINKEATIEKTADQSASQVKTDLPAVPKTPLPEIRAPETRATEAKISQTKVPDSKAPEAKVSVAKATPKKPVIEKPVAENKVAKTKLAKTDTDAAKVVEKAEAVVADSQYVNLVDNFTVGVWFEKADQGSSPYRCRLAAIIRSTGKYIFVNRAGVKVAEETRESLALQLHTGKLRTLDDSMLFDRALESVITNLRRSK